MIILFSSTLDLEKGLTVKMCENVSHNEVAHKQTESKWRSGAATRRTLMTRRQPHCHVIKLYQHSWTHSNVTFSLDLLIPPCDVAVQPKSQFWTFGECRHTKFSIPSSSLCSCRGIAECGDPPVSMPTGIDVEKNSILACNLAPAFHKTHSAKLQVHVHCLMIQMFCFQVNTVVISTNSGHLDVSIDQEAWQPQRWGCDVSEASTTSSHYNGSSCRCVQFDFEAGTVNSITSPFRFDFDSLLLQNHSKFAHHWNTTNSRSCCLDRCVEFGFGTRETATACVVDVDFRRCFRWKVWQELVPFLLCKHPAKFASMKHVILNTISCLSKLWMHRGCFNKKRMHLFNASTLAVVTSAIALVNSLLANRNLIRTEKYASLMTLELYDVASCGESLTVRELSLGRSPAVFTSLLLNCKPDFWSTTLHVLDQLRSQYVLALF